MLNLTAHHLRFKLKVDTPIELDRHQGAALRGMLFNALRGPKHNPALGFCTQRHLSTCAECALVAACPVAGLVSTLDPRSERGRDLPRPYAIVPPRLPQPRYEPGEIFNFGLTLFGQALSLFPYVVMALRQAGPGGLGKKIPQPENGRRFQRGKFIVQAAETINLFTGEVQDILEPDSTMVQQPNLPVTHTQIMALSRQWLESGIDPNIPMNLAISFETPTRLVERKQLLKTPIFTSLFHRLLDRLLTLEREFGGNGARPEVDKSRLLALADGVELVANRTRWEEVWSYSARQGKKTPISGLVGAAVYQAPRETWEQLLPYLLWGQVIHVGKNAVKGDGIMAIHYQPGATGQHG